MRDLRYFLFHKKNSSIFLLEVIDEVLQKKRIASCSHQQIQSNLKITKNQTENLREY